jgi:hypothetical protein
MIKRFLFVGTFLSMLLFSCELSGEQEEQLNIQLAKYMEAHNNRTMLQLVGMTEPEIVRYYKQAGDSAFLEHFKDFYDDELTYLANPTYRETKSSGKLIQRKYWVEYYTNTKEIDHELPVYALSDDGGNTWLFAREEDYLNDEIKFKRLFTD